MAENDDKKDPPATGDDDGMTTDAGKKALQAERDKVKALEQKFKDAMLTVDQLKPLADKAQKLEDDKLGETEKLTKQIGDLTKERDAATAKADRYEVALEKGLNLTRAKRLVGATRDELTADADELLADLGTTKDGDGKKPPPSGKPAENLRGGGDPDDSPPVDVRKVVDSIPRGF